MSKNHVRATHIHSALADCCILKYLLSILVQNHPGLQGDLGHPNMQYPTKVSTPHAKVSTHQCNWF